MAESQQYLLGNEKYVTVSIDENNSEIYRVNSDGTRTIFADFNDGVITPSSFSTEEFQRNLAQGTFTNTINESIDNARGLPPTQVTDPNQPGASGGSTPANPNQEVSEGTPEQTDFKYPEKLSLDQDVIQFKAVKYIPPGLGEQNTATNTRESQNRTIEGTVTLPIQAQISDSNIVGWGEGALDEITRKALNTAANITKGTINDETFATNLQSTIKDFTSNQDQTLALLAEKVIGLQNIQGRTGGILNPNVELLFNGPQLRPFSFSFRMIPRTKKESEQIKGIIKFFKKNMAVKRDTGLFLKAPNTFLIKYLQKGAEEHKSINKIKECALIGFDVNYTPQGSYMTYEDGTMASYNITLAFKELVPIYYEDYKPDHPIGF
jgi:hypothetical protein